MAGHPGTERLRCAPNQPATLARHGRALHASRFRRPLPEFLCSQPRDLCPLQSPPVLGAIRLFQRSPPAPCRRWLGKRARAIRLRLKKSEVGSRDRAARCPSSFHRPSRLLLAAFCSPPPPASPRCCSRPVRQSPSAPECHAPLSTRCHRSIRSRPTPRRVYVSFFDRINRINKIASEGNRFRSWKSELFLKFQTFSSEI